jgi:hypothetical protein
MGNMNDYYPSPWLRAEDLDGAAVMTIRQVKDEEFPGQRGESDQIRPVVFFKEHDKGLILNKTNFVAMTKITGQSNTERWIGTRIQLRVQQVPAFGEVVDSIRVYPSPTTRRHEGGDEEPDWVTDPV